MSLNMIITYLLYMIKLVEASVLKLLNRNGSHTYSSWDEFMNSLTTTAPSTTPSEPTEETLG